METGRRNRGECHYAADSRHEPVMKPRQLLQALRRARHQSIATVSTTCQTRVDADLSTCDSAQKRAGVTSVSRPFCRLHLSGLLSITSSALPHAENRSNLSMCYNSNDQALAGLKRSSGALAVALHRRKFTLGSLTIFRYELPHEETLASLSSAYYTDLVLNLLTMTEDWFVRLAGPD
jgi:hypothetical protein